MIPLRRLLACATVALGATVAFGAAATLGIGSDNVAAGSAVVGNCVTDNDIDVDYEGDPDPVTGLLVSGLDDCDGGLLEATVTQADGTFVASGQATVVGTTADIDLGGSFDPALVQRYVIAVVTP